MKEEKTETLNEFFIWSKLCNLKTASRTVSVQVQLVSYKCQPGHTFFSDQCQINGHDLIGSGCHTATQAQLSTRAWLLHSP